MAYTQRQEIIKKMEEIRGTKIVTYIISTRPGINAMIEARDIRIFFEHLNNAAFANSPAVDLFIYSNGGESTMAWALVNLIREFTDNFSVVIPFNAFSCATSIASGANKIIMSKMGTLGPIDPSVVNEFNPIINNHYARISVEDVSGYNSLIESKFKINKEKNRTELLKKLTDSVQPLALGNVYRNYLKCRDDSNKLLNLHFDHKKDKKRIEKITSTLIEKLYFHGHPINREEAKNIGLEIIDAEDISQDYAKLAWDLYQDYEKEMKFSEPYQDELATEGSSTTDIPIKYIESTVKGKTYKIKQTYTDLNLPAGSRLIDNNGKIAVLTPTNTLLPIIGSLVMINGKIYDKKEILVWE